MRTSLRTPELDRTELAAGFTHAEAQRAAWNALLPSLRRDYLHRWVAISGSTVVASADDALGLAKEIEAKGHRLQDVFVDYVRDGSERYLL